MPTYMVNNKSAYKRTKYRAESKNRTEYSLPSGSLLCRKNITNNRLGQGHDHTAAQTLDTTVNNELFHTCRSCTQHGPDHKDDRTDQVHHSPAKQVG